MRTYGILPLLVAGLPAIGAPALTAAVPAQSDQTFLISANIDGRDQLIIRGDTLRWHHFENAAVGRHGGTDSQTILETSKGQVEWRPVWPEPPPAQIRYEAYSSTLSTGFNVLPADSLRWRLTKLSGRAEVHIVAQPSAANQYTMIVEFDDNGPIGSSFYSVRLSPVLQVVLDLRPSNRVNGIVPGSDKTIQVAVFSNLLQHDFDATLIQPSSITLGRYLARPLSYTHADVNGDGKQDAVLTFRIDQTGISCGDSEVQFSATTADGQDIEGRDIVRTLGCQ